MTISRETQWQSTIEMVGKKIQSPYAISLPTGTPTVLGGRRLTNTEQNFLTFLPEMNMRKNILIKIKINDEGIKLKQGWKEAQSCSSLQALFKERMKY